MNLYITENGYTWSFPLMEVVINRANYYADLEKANGYDYDEIRTEEIKYGRENPDCMLDWYADNMNVSDIALTRYRLVKEPVKPEYPSSTCGDGVNLSMDLPK